MKNSSKLMKEARAALALHPRCGAKCKQRDGFCMNPAMKNGRCRIPGVNLLGPSPNMVELLLGPNQGCSKSAVC